MSCPHSSRPGPCSSCAGEPARIVTISNGQTLIDGIPSGPAITAPEMPQPKRRRKVRK